MPSQNTQYAVPKQKQQPFSKQSGGQYNRNLKLFKVCLTHLSGNEPAFFLVSYLNTPTGRKLGMELMNSKLKSVLLQILEHHKYAPSKNKKIWLSIIAPIFTRNELKEFGFKFSTNQFTKALQHKITTTTTTLKEVIIKKKKKRRNK